MSRSHGKPGRCTPSPAVTLVAEGLALLDRSADNIGHPILAAQFRLALADLPDWAARKASTSDAIYLHLHLPTSTLCLHLVHGTEVTPVSVEIAGMCTPVPCNDPTCDVCGVEQ